MQQRKHSSFLPLWNDKSRMWYYLLCLSTNLLAPLTVYWVWSDRRQLLLVSNARTVPLSSIKINRNEVDSADEFLHLGSIINADNGFPIHTTTLLNNEEDVFCRLHLHLHNKPRKQRWSSAQQWQVSAALRIWRVKKGETSKLAPSWI